MPLRKTILGLALLLTPAAIAQPAEVALATWRAPVQLQPQQRYEHYQRILLSCGAKPAPGELWVLGLPSQLSSKTCFVVLTPEGQVHEFDGTSSPNALSAGTYLLGQDLKVVGQPQTDTGLTINSEEFRNLTGPGAFRFALVNVWQPAPEAPSVTPLIPSIPPASAGLSERFNYYQRLILARGGKLTRGTTVLGLRGISPDGRRHPSSDNIGAYDDTYVILRRDSKGQPQLSEFLGSTHAGDSSDPSVPQGVAQLRPGHYKAQPYGHHHQMPCWLVVNHKGSKHVRAARDVDADGSVSPDEVQLAEGRGTTASDILFHNGIWEDRCASIGCLTMAPDTHSAFVHALGARTPFDFTLVDANEPIDLSCSTYTLGRSAQGRPLNMYVLGSGPKIALLFGNIHGDEPAGQDLLVRLKRHLQEDPARLNGWQVRIMPCLNPDNSGRARTNPRGVDLNRNFPALWQLSARDDEYSGPKPLSEPESRCLREAALGLGLGPAGRVQRILSIHQHRGIPSGQGMLDGDGPSDSVAPLVAAMQEAAPDRLTAQKIADSHGRVRIPGSFGTWVSSREISIPTVTYELAHGDSPENSWAWNRAVLMSFLSNP
ncbi:MAG: hypothetical protein J0I12_28085 [Candidatus Eremiobacteraeota bacterium]|nr:hypothetical protein [Candidatus Eremiobacteraeota bacterium]